ncbi:hypothetical protein CLCR_08423 [Cladophialophora carrionii]|uniref:Uncharacterized protein n=1 Tax=Cladophialophora carrionii TaxID=86049 RepID=A0A1C1CSC6_9EURO|nr:hypothetical protein CLCR_08423 [Cladophialophora carrionii]
MGSFDDVGHAFESAATQVADTIQNTAESARGAIAGAATTASTAISGTARTGADTVVQGVVNGTDAALEAMDPERKKRRKRMQQAQQEWSRLDDEANEALKAAQLQAKVGQEYDRVGLNPNTGLEGLTRLAMVLRSHSVEKIRETKMEQGGNMDPSNFHLQVTDESPRGFMDATDSASALFFLVGGLTVQARDVDHREIPTLLAYMASFGEFSSSTIAAQRASASTAQKAINDLEKNVQEQRQEVADHLHMNMKDVRAGIGKAILNTFGASFPDNKWDDFLQSHYTDIQNCNKDIVQNQTSAAIANGIVEQATPIVGNIVDTLASLAALASQLESLNANLNKMKIQVDDMVEVFTTLSESKHFTLSTAGYVKKLGQIGATSFRVDACCSSVAGAMFAQLMRIAITHNNKQCGYPRQYGSKLKTCRKRCSAEWEAALALPLQCSLRPLLTGSSTSTSLLKSRT